MATRTSTTDFRVDTVTTHRLRISTPEIPNLGPLDEVVVTLSMGEHRDRVIRLTPAQVMSLADAQDPNRGY